MFKKVILHFIAHLFLIASFISLLPIWIGDLFSHFRMFWTVFSIFLLIIYSILFNQKKVNSKAILIVLLALFINFVSSYSFWTNSQTYEYLFFGSPTLETLYNLNPTEDVHKDTTVKSLLLMNVLSSNTNYEDVKRTIKNTEADFVVIIELNKKWKTELNYLKEDYPYQFTDVREDNFGMGLYSKKSYAMNYSFDKIDNQNANPNKVKEFYQQRPISYPTYFKNLAELNLVVAHPFPPISSKGYKQRNDYLDKITDFVGSSSLKKVLFVGDLNCSPFSADYKNFLKQSGLKDSQENFGFQPTWNSAFPFLMQTQLDHVWHSEDIEMLHRQTLPIEGSDHKAVLVFFR